MPGAASRVRNGSVYARDVVSTWPTAQATIVFSDGSNIKLSEQAGNVVLLNFWASWCGPCRKEMPLLNELHDKYSPLGFSVLGVNVELDSDQARRTGHLTTRACAEIANSARVEHLLPFHFSKRYIKHAADVYREIHAISPQTVLPGFMTSASG